ncbi:hypothetical protein [Halarcobacter anaerophilus]|uniref:hypothetical protein n=1 Tax=Halarcobacter anaerophilus TaxID=877500 RepID=UPI0005C8E139|nr:hypothetical protein [Halarcobacter anaerophilus]
MEVGTFQTVEDSNNTSSLYKGSDSQNGIFEAQMIQHSVAALPISEPIEFEGVDLTKKDLPKAMIKEEYNEDTYEELQQIRQRSIDMLNSGTIMKAVLNQEENV